MGVDPASLAITAGTDILSLLFGGGKNKSQNQWGMADTGVYPFGPYERQQFGDAYMEGLSNLFSQYQSDPTGMKMAGLFRSQAGKAKASLIDMNDIAFTPEPTAGLREDVYGRLHSGALAQAADAKANMMRALASSGQSANSPYAMYLANKIDRSAGAAATGGLTTFYDDFVQGALGRRAGALGENAQLGTDVSKFNAHEGNAMFMQGSQYGQQNLEMLLRALQWGMSPNDHQQIVNGGQTTSYQPGGADVVGALAGAVRDSQRTGRRAGAIDPGVAADTYSSLEWL
jgi:hypothetical protein